MIAKLFPPPVLAALHADLQKNEWFLEMPVLHHPSGKRGVKIVVRAPRFPAFRMAKTYIRICDCTALRLPRRLRWPRLSEQFFRVDTWSVCRVRLPSGVAAG